MIRHMKTCAVARVCRLCKTPFVAAARKAFYCSVECRFWAKVDKRGPDECWPWIGSLKSNGYGQFSLEDGQRVPASRLSLAMHLGRNLERNQHACHRCDNPPCVNPAHLFLGGARANHLDCIAKGRTAKSYNRGTSNPKAKLTEDQVRYIRRLAGAGSYKEIAQQAGVPKSVAYKVITGRAWAHVT